MRWSPAILVLFVCACSTAPQSPDGESQSASAEVHRPFFRPDHLTWVDVSPEWGWHVTPSESFIEMLIGRSTVEAELVDSTLVFRRAWDVEEADHFKLFQYEPPELEWVDDERRILQFEFPVPSVEKRYRDAAWGMPMARGSLNGERPFVLLAQMSEGQEMPIIRKTLSARRYTQDEAVKLAYWDVHTSEITDPASTLVRLRYFDPNYPEWAAIVDALDGMDLAGSELGDTVAADAGQRLQEELGFPLD